MNSNFSGKRSGIPGLVLGFGGFVMAGVIAVFGMVGYTFYEGARSLNMPEQKVQELAPQIVDPNVSARTLESEGYYKVKFGGFYLDGCREKVLTDSFNANLSTQAKADKINDCIYQNIVETSASANRTVTIRHR